MLWALLRRYAGPYRSLLAIVAGLQLISTLASLYLPTVNAAIIDDGVAKGDLRTIVELGGIMLAVTAMQVVCAVGAVYFGSRASMSVGRDLRSAIFGHVTGFSAEETARFGAPSLLTRTTNDVQQVQLFVQLTCTMLITAPIMSIGGIIMAVHQNAGLSWLLLISVPVLALANYLIVSPSDADLPATATADRRHQPGDARAALRHQGDPGIRAGTVRAQPVRRRKPARWRTQRWKPGACRRSCCRSPRW